MGITEIIALIVAALGGGGIATVVVIIKDYLLAKNKNEADIQKDERGQIYQEYRNLVTQLQENLLQLRQTTLKYQEEYVRVLEENKSLKNELAKVKRDGTTNISN